MNQPADDVKPETLAADIEQYIAQAETLMREGKLVPLAELNESVEALCKRVMHLRVDEAKLYVPQLEALRERLDALQAVMEQEKSRLADEIGASSQRQKAVRAYRPPGEKP